MRRFLILFPLLFAGCSASKLVTVSNSQSASTPSPTLAPATFATPTTPSLIPRPVSTATPKSSVPKGFEKEQEVVVSQLSVLQRITPEQALELAWSSNDFRFLGVRGYATEVFGVPGGIINALVRKHGVKPIEGTGDFVFSDEQAQLQKLATDYSIRYNRLLLARLENS